MVKVISSGQKSVVKPLVLKIPENTKITLEENGVLKISGPKGELTQSIEKGITARLLEGEIVLEAESGDKQMKAMHGLVRALLRNAIVGVNEGFKKTLELSGVGYRASLSGDQLTLSLGFSHPVVFTAPSGIAFTVAENKITISGIDKHLVGQTAHTIRSARPPEPYKGKGIKYEGERIRRKAGKAAAKTVGAK